MAPVPMESILATPTWPASLAHFVTWCLMWDPRSRPTSVQALQHEYFKDAVDPLLPRTSTPSRMARKTSELTMKPSRDSMTEGIPSLEKKSSWFRKSFMVSPPPTTNPEARPRVEKRSTWHAPKVSSGGGQANNGAPMMILPSIRPVSPLSDAVSVQAARSENRTSSSKERRSKEEKAVKKIGRQLSIASKKSHEQNDGYTNGVQQAVDKLNGNVPGSGIAGGGGSAVTSPVGRGESFFSHLRKRARRLSSRTSGLPPSPEGDDQETGVGCGIWGTKDSGSNRSSMLVDSPGDVSGIDKTIKEVDAALAETNGVYRSNSANMRRNLSFPPTPNASRAGETVVNGVAQTPTFPRTRRSVRNTKQRYETPDEHDEIADEVAASCGYSSRQTSQTYEAPARKGSNKDLRHVSGSNGYPTPNPQTGNQYYAKGMDIGGKMRRDDEMMDPKWPTPPSEGDAGWGQSIYSRR